MAVWLFYVDESYDNNVFCLSAVVFRHSAWKTCFDQVRKFRERLNQDFGIYLRKEIHAHKFLGGRGKVSNRVVSKWERSRIFNNILQLIASLPEVMVFNICLQQCEHKDPQMIAWDRLLNRIERTMLAMEQREIPARKERLARLKPEMGVEDFQDLERRLLKYSPRAMIVADEGREQEITRALRKMHVYNPVPFRFVAWGDGNSTRNITTDRIIEDPIFKDSSRSYFIQLADCVAYALLKRETPAIPRIKRYGIDKMFAAHLSGVCFTSASKSDPLGIVRS